MIRDDSVYARHFLVAQFRLDPGQIEVLDDEMAEILRQKTEGERLRIAGGMWVSARKTNLSFLHDEHPGWPERQLLEEVVRRLSHGAV